VKSGVAKVLPLRHAIGADAAGVAEPGDADPLAEAQPRYARPDRLDAADDLVTGDDRRFRIGQVSVQNMQVGATDAAGEHLDPHLALARFAVRQLGPDQRRLRLEHHHGLHGL